MKSKESTQKDLKFIKSWEKQRKNRFRYVVVHSFVLSMLISIVLIYINDINFPEDTVKFLVVTAVVFIFNAIFQYFLNYSIQERRYQSLIKKQSLDDIGQ